MSRRLALSRPLPPATPLLPPPTIRYAKRRAILRYTSTAIRRATRPLTQSYPHSSPPLHLPTCSQPPPLLRYSGLETYATPPYPICAPLLPPSTTILFPRFYDDCSTSSFSSSPLPPSIFRPSQSLWHDGKSTG
ncbi:hypothetical protein DFH09DRAFT_1327720 [Mycena vulgaris]|nr:hypothetical protein DFH09DRAFT_1327720 [Mycena vulgaris]